MTTVSACDTNMFLPFPSYWVFSLDASKSSFRVGSRFSTRGFFPDFFPGRVVECVIRGGAAWALEAGVEDPVNMGMNSHAEATIASTTSTAAQDAFLLFSRS